MFFKCSDRTDGRIDSLPFLGIYDRPTNTNQPTDRITLTVLPTDGHFSFSMYLSVWHLSQKKTPDVWVGHSDVVPRDEDGPVHHQSRHRARAKGWLPIHGFSGAESGLHSLLCPSFCPITVSSSLRVYRFTEHFLFSVQQVDRYGG